jgi:hypothetical protein
VHYRRIDFPGGATAVPSQCTVADMAEALLRMRERYGTPSLERSPSCHGMTTKATFEVAEGRRFRLGVKRRAFRVV